jgi:diguanylate cyclase (GGDEF)-like protein
MNPAFKPSIRQLFIPHGLLLAASGLLLSWKLRTVFVFPAGELIVFAIAAGVVLLAWRFRSPRVLLAALLLVIAERVLMWTATGALRSSGHLMMAVSILLPLNIAVLLLVDELTFDIETFAWWGGFLLIQGLFVVAINRPEQDFLLVSLGSPLIKSISLPTTVSQASVAIFIVAGFAVLFVSMVSEKPTDKGLFWGVCACFLGLNATRPGVTSGYFAIAALTLGIAVIQKSYLIAYHDELTGLPGRRSFNEALATLEHEFSIAMLDIDHFKRFNDTFGHAVGDQVLRMVATRLSEVEGGGKPFRYGGEEFAIVFRGNTAEEAFEYVDKVRQDIERSVFAVRGPDRSTRKRRERRYRHNRRGLRRRQRADVHVTVSVGLAEPSRTLVTVADVVQAADKALYRAKEHGRNRVEIHGIRQVRRVGRGVS